MSLILKGIDLPKEGEWLEVIIKPSREVIVDTIRYRDNALLKTEYESAIQIPKDHGRIGDLDELQKAIRTDIMGGLNYGYFIRNAPTILEEEK